MTEKDFNKLMKKAMAKKHANKMMNYVFGFYDSNKDGHVDFVEFMLVFHIMSDGTPHEILEKIFRLFDFNNDGTITKAEMTKIIKDMYGLIKKDPRVQSEACVVETAFAEMDYDGDGKIELYEFIDACLNQEELSRMLALKIYDILHSPDAAVSDFVRLGPAWIDSNVASQFHIKPA